MLSLTLVGCLLLGVIAYLIISGRRNKSKLSGKIPPGPRGVPIFGNVLQLDRQLMVNTINKWSEEYGEIYKIQLGRASTYVINDHKWVKELFSQDAAFSGRMKLGDCMDLFANGRMHGILNTEGEHWEQLRRFTLRQLRDFGFGKSTMETLIMEELQEILEWMKSHEGESISGIKEKMTIAVVNSLWTILSGHRYKHDDPVLQSLTKSVTNVLEDMATTGGMIFFAPWVRHIAPVWSGYTAMRKVMTQFREMFSKSVEEHKQTYAEDSQRDFIDVFIKEIKACEDVNSAFFGELGERQLVAVIGDLFLAGSDTTSTTLDWVFLYLSTFPEVQKKLQQEIDAVVGNSRHCGLSDRIKLPYAEAVLAEVLRYSSIVSNGVGHRAVVDREFKGYAIPQDTMLLANLHFIHHDPKIWGDPKNFRPERFLSPDGKSFKKHEALLPFLIGRRQCAGETLARDTLFLYTTNIFQRFHVKFDPRDGKANPGMGPRPGFMLNPKPYKVVFKDRMV